MPFEAAPSPNEERRSGREAAERSYTTELQLETLAEQYRELQQQIMEKETDLEKGNAKAAGLGANHPMKDLSITLGKKLTEELVALANRKIDLEQKIKDAGGNPSDYTTETLQ